MSQQPSSSFQLPLFGPKAVVPQTNKGQQPSLPFRLTSSGAQGVISQADKNQQPSSPFQFPPFPAQATVPQLSPPSDRRESRSQGNQSYRPKTGASAISSSPRGFISALSHNEGAARNTFRDGKEASNSAGSRDIEGSTGELSHHYD